MRGVLPPCCYPMLVLSSDPHIKCIKYLTGKDHIAVSAAKVTG